MSCLFFSFHIDVLTRQKNTLDFFWDYVALSMLTRVNKIDVKICKMTQETTHYIAVLSLLTRPKTKFAIDFFWGFGALPMLTRVKKIDVKICMLTHIDVLSRPKKDTHWVFSWDFGVLSTLTKEWSVKVWAHKWGKNYKLNSWPMNIFTRHT